MSNTSAVNLLEEEKEQNEIKDRLSNLSDDILVSILSLVDRKDATRTSILSKSWRYLATYFTTMDFDGFQTLIECRRQHKSAEYEVRRFPNLVDQVVTLHRAPFINDFRIRLPLIWDYSRYINNWIKFAISKRVNKLELDFICRTTIFPYSIPSNVFEGSQCESGISYLTSICLKYVQISEEVLELLLSRCHLLERLYISGADKLSNVKIINLSKKLKYLAVRSCFGLKELEIDAVNLQSFEFSGRANVVYASVPSLVEARFQRLYSNGLLPSFLQIKCVLAQLSKLFLDVDMFDENLVIPSFPNVKCLELRVMVKFHRNLLPLMCLAEACPLLYELKLEVQWWCDCQIELSDSESELDSENELDSESESESYCENGEYSLEDVKHWLETQEEGTSATLPNLRKLEWTGAFSVHDKLEIPLALYCVKNASILQKFICNPRHRPSYLDDHIAEIEEHGRRWRAEKLAMAIPSHVHFVIL